MFSSEAMPLSLFVVPGAPGYQSAPFGEVRIVPSPPVPPTTKIPLPYVIEPNESSVPESWLVQVVKLALLTSGIKKTKDIRKADRIM
jgi:hypothetical protein